MSVSHGLIVPRFCSLCFRGTFSVFSIDRFLLYFTLLSGFCVWKFSLIHWPLTFCHPSLTFLLTSALKLSFTSAFSPLNIWQQKPLSAFILFCSHYDITCAKWHCSPFLVYKICNIFWDGSVPIFWILFFIWVPC